MSEMVNTYLLRDPDQVIPMGREEFYEEQMEIFKKTGKPTRAIEIIQILLFTPDKQVILQKRSKSKKHNPGLIDKSIGGHIISGDSPTYTVMTETLQELKIPSFVIDTEDDFVRTLKLLKNFLNTSALIQYIDTRIYNSEKIIGKEKFVIANKYHFYLGVYHGAILPADKEASGVIFYDYSELLDEIKEYPDLYTTDLKFFLAKYEKRIRDLLRVF